MSQKQPINTIIDDSDFNHYLGDLTITVEKGHINITLPEGTDSNLFGVETLGMLGKQLVDSLPESYNISLEDALDLDVSEDESYELTSHVMLDKARLHDDECEEPFLQLVFPKVLNRREMLVYIRFLVLMMFERFIKEQTGEDLGLNVEEVTVLKERE